jgi:hypothetical protein
MTTANVSTLMLPQPRMRCKKHFSAHSTDVPESCCRENCKSTWIMMVQREEENSLQGENEKFSNGYEWGSSRESLGMKNFLFSL